MKIITQIIFSLLLAHGTISANESNTNTLGIAGWRESVISVYDIEQWVKTFEDIYGWTVIDAKRKLSNTHLTWNLPPTVEYSEVLMGNKGASTGFIRFVKFHDINQQQIRPSAQPWESGGYFDLNFRTKDIFKTYKELQNVGWQGYSEPLSYTFGRSEIYEWLAKAPDGVIMMKTQRLKPKLEGWPNLKKTSRSFNSTQIVSDMDSSLYFYQEVLKFGVYLFDESKGKGEENILALPFNINEQVKRTVYILSPKSDNEGSIELLAFDGARGRDFSKNGHEPNLGILTIRFPVRDIQALKRHLESARIPNIGVIKKFPLQPYGLVSSLIVIGPSGERIEFIESDSFFNKTINAAL